MMSSPQQDPQQHQELASKNGQDRTSTSGGEQSSRATSLSSTSPAPPLAQQPEVQLQPMPAPAVSRERPWQSSNRMVRRGSFDHLSSLHRNSLLDASSEKRRGGPVGRVSTAMAAPQPPLEDVESAGLTSSSSSSVSTATSSRVPQPALNKTAAKRIHRASLGATNAPTLVPNVGFGTKLRRAPSLKSTRAPSPNLVRKRVSLATLVGQGPHSATSSASASPTPPSSNTSPPSGIMVSSTSSSSSPSYIPQQGEQQQQQQQQQQQAVPQTASQPESKDIAPPKEATDEADAISPPDSVPPPLPSSVASSSSSSSSPLATGVPTVLMPSPTPLPSSPAHGAAGGAPPQFQQRVERVLKARLYLLQQSGPNSFIIAGDSTDQKFKVTIGSQKCSCSKANCIHVLFVMVRVLKVEQTSSLLWSKKLHNFEAESLLNQFRNRQARRMNNSSRANRRHSTGVVSLRKRPLQPNRSSSVIEPRPNVQQENADESGAAAATAPLVVVSNTSSSPLTRRGCIKKTAKGGATPEKGTASAKGIDERGEHDEKTDSDSSEDSRDITSDSQSASSSSSEDSSADSAEAVAAALAATVANDGEHLHDEDDEDEDVCPICLLEMVDGESMITCTKGCHNRLHMHCIRIWALERRRQGEPLHCPLCRADWPDLPSPSDDGSLSGRGSQTYSDPISEQYAEAAAAWIKVFGRDTVVSLFSRGEQGWLTRQNALGHLQRDFMSKMMDCRRSATPQTSDSVTSSSSSHINQSPEWPVDDHTQLWSEPAMQLIECSLDIVEHCVMDKVITVYDAALKFLHTVLSYVPVTSQQQIAYLRQKLTPTISTILTKCAELHRRKREQSMRTLREFCLDRQGKLALGSALGSRHASLSLGGVEFIMQQVANTDEQRRHSGDGSWHYWLGRMRFLDMLLTEERLPVCEEDKWTADECKDCVAYVASQACPSLLDAEQPALNSMQVQRALPFKHIIQTVLFARSAMKIQHITVTRMSRRVFLHSAKLALTWGQPARCLIRAIVDCLSSPHYSTMKQRLRVHDDECEDGERASVKYKRVRNRSRAFSLASPVSLLSPPISDNERSFYVPTGPQLDDSAEYPLLSTDEPVDVAVEATRPHPVTTSSVESSAVPSPAPRSGPASRAGTSMSVSHSHSSLATMTHSDVLDLRRQSSDGSSQEHSSSMSFTRPGTGADGGSGTGLQLVASTEAAVTVGGRGSSFSSPICVDNAGSLVQQPRPASGNEHSQAIHSCVQPASNAQSTIPAPDASGMILFAIGDAPESRNSEAASATSDLDFDSNSSEELKLGTKSSPDINAPPSLPIGNDVTDGPEENTENRNDSVRKPGSLSKIMSMANSPERTIDRFDSGIESDTRQRYYETTCAQLVEAEVEATSAATEASLYEVPLPPLHGLAPPDELVSIHEQPMSGEQPDGGNNIYMEGVHWKKGPMIGSGAFSTVFAARDVAVGTLMCAKQVSFVRNTEPEQQRVLRDIQDEVSMLSRLEHPNVVRCLGATKEATHFYIFVEWMPGGSISELLRRYGAFTDRVITTYLQQILRGTAYLHDNRVIHRDIKGANILVDSTGQHVRLSDFGASARMQAHLTGDKEFEGDGHGTVAFMAPEVLRGDPYGRSSDVWSIGCTTIEMLTGSPPWAASDATNRFRLIFRIASATEPPEIPPFCPQALRDVCLRCLEMTPTERPRAADLLKHPVFNAIASSS